MSINISKESLSIPLMKTNCQIYGPMNHPLLSLHHSPLPSLLIKQMIKQHLKIIFPNLNRNSKYLTLLTEVKEKSVENSEETDNSHEDPPHAPLDFERGPWLDPANQAYG